MNPVFYSSHYAPISTFSLSQKWTDVEKVRFSIGKVSCHGNDRGCGILIGIDRMIVPYHIISESCPRDLEIHFQNEDNRYCYSYKFNVLKFLVLNPELDFCILQLSKDKDGSWPGNLIGFPEISYDSYNGDCLLAHFDRESPSTQIVKSGGSYLSSYYSTVATLPGYSGSGYFDPHGRLFAMHLARSSGLCGINTQVRKAIYLNEIFASSKEVQAILNIPRCMPVCPPTTTPACAPAFSNKNICFINEGRPAINGKIGNISYWEYRPKNASGPGPRGITLAIPAGRCKMTYMFCENPHHYAEYNQAKDQGVLYKNAVEAYLVSSRGGSPERFSFSAFGHVFNAQILERVTFGT